MCSSWSRALLLTGVFASFVVHWMVVLAIWALVAQILTRITHKAWWPSTLACGLPSGRRRGYDN